MPCKPINPNLMFSTDDATMCIFEGVEDKKSKWTIVSTNARKNKGLFGTHEINENTEN